MRPPLRSGVCRAGLGCPGRRNRTRESTGNGRRRFSGPVHRRAVDRPRRSGPRVIPPTPRGLGPPGDTLDPSGRPGCGRSAAAAEQVDVVFHSAAVAGIWGPWEHFHSVNTTGTLNVIEACRRAGVRKLIYTSSPSVTFDGGDQCGINETQPYPTRWLCHYPHTKALAEQAVLRANGQQGLLTCALRPHLIWGPRDAHLVPRLFDRARRGRLRQVGNATNLVDMVHVENAAQAHLLAADALSEHSPVAGSAVLHQSRGARQLLAVDQSAAGTRRPARRREEDLVCRRLADRRGVRVDLPAVTDQPRASHDSLPGRATGHIPLFRHHPGADRTGLLARSVHRGGHAPPGADAGPRRAGRLGNLTRIIHGPFVVTAFMRSECSTRIGPDESGHYKLL